MSTPMPPDVVDRVLAAWRSPDAMSVTVPLGIGRLPAPMAAVIELTEIVVHGLDVAVATGPEDAVDEPQAAALLELMHGLGVDAFRVPGVFGPALPASEAAPPHVRLLAFVGRGPAAAAEAVSR